MTSFNKLPAEHILLLQTQRWKSSEKEIQSWIKTGVDYNEDVNKEGPWDKETFE